MSEIPYRWGFLLFFDKKAPRLTEGLSVFQLVILAYFVFGLRNLPSAKSFRASLDDRT
jgi:hypothetical protein